MLNATSLFVRLYSDSPDFLMLLYRKLHSRASPHRKCEVDRPFSINYLRFPFFVLTAMLNFFFLEQKCQKYIFPAEC